MRPVCASGNLLTSPTDMHFPGTVHCPHKHALNNRHCDSEIFKYRGLILDLTGLYEMPELGK